MLCPNIDDTEPISVVNGLETVWMGPYSCAIFGLDSNGDYDTNVGYQPGSIKQLYIHEWNSIDGLQFLYENHLGNFIGDRNGGKAHTLDVPDGAHVNGLNMRFAKGIMCRVEVRFSDGTTSAILGNRGGWAGADVVAEPTGYKLVCGDFRVGGGPSYTLGTGVIMIQFDFPTSVSVPASSSTLDEEELHDLLG